MVKASRTAAPAEAQGELKKKSNANAGARNPQAMPMSHLELTFLLLFVFCFWRRPTPAADAKESAMTRELRDECRKIRKQRRAAARAAREAKRAAQGEAIAAFFALIGALLRADSRGRAWRLFMAPFADRRRRRIEEAAILLRAVEPTRFWI
jgi:hypothetical protein